MDIMGKLLASQQNKPLKLFRGQEIEGEIVSITDKEITLDLGTKSEGIIPTHDISKDQLEQLKVGHKIKSFVVVVENESGQVLLSPNPYSAKSTSKGKRSDWNKFIDAKNQKTKLSGKVMEVNKGGLIIEIGGTRAFLPNSQIGFELLSRLKEGMDKLVDQQLRVSVIEVDQDNNKIILSQRGQVSDDLLDKLRSFKTSQKVQGKIVAILPFGLVIDIDGVEGLIFIADVSWERTEDLSGFSTGDEVEAQVLGVDKDFGRLNLSLKHLSEDPFVQLSANFEPDKVVKGEITTVDQAGITLKLDGGVEGFLPASKMDPTQNYQVGQSITLLVDNVDTQRRRVNLAPFVTSTEGLIYK
ncbi:30S ribosomal protein S1 [Candidatus Daviesbacteria bacterium]|nr:30S ribosomal protein S1 [Candidatus Daviesbacteria bacterium]